MIFENMPVTDFKLSFLGVAEFERGLYYFKIENTNIEDNLNKLYL